jgi:uncharacterized repeat protein (TIGR01451 family)
MNSSEAINGLLKGGGRTLTCLAAFLVLIGLAVLVRGGPAAPAAPTDPADLALQKSDSPDPVAAGGTLTYTIFVTNAGPNPAVNVIVTDDLPTGLDFVSATASAGSCDHKGRKVTCNLGTVANPGPPTANLTVTITTTVKQNFKGAAITNTASVASDNVDPQTNNNSDTESTTVTKPASFSCLGKQATILGTAGNDTITGTDKGDVILAFAGSDRVLGLGGKDLICARGGADVVDAGPNPDAVSGGRGRDLLVGRGGGDELRGNAGRDRLRGNAGNDFLRGGAGRDRCRGGPGSDTISSCER